MQSFDLGLACPECSQELLDLGDEIVCSSCGLVGSKEVVDSGSSRPPVAADFTKQSLGSYFGPSNSAGSLASGGLPTSNSTYRYLKTISDFAGRDGGASYDCSKLIERVTEKLGLPRIVMAQAIVIGKKLVPLMDTMRQATVATISAYSIIVACKMEGVATASTKDVLQALSSLGRRVKVSSMIQLSLESGIKIGARRPEDYVSTILAKLSGYEEVRKAMEKIREEPSRYMPKLHVLADEILLKIGTDEREGRRPSALAATAIYAAEVMLAEAGQRGRVISQRDVATGGETAEYTIREQYRRLFVPALSNSKLELEQYVPVRTAR